MKQLRIHSFMHVPFEGLGCIESWITAHNHSLSYTRFFEKYKLPSVTEIDWLIVMGGPMGVYDETEYPWLKDEKKFIAEAIVQGKTVIGICLGSQLIAEVLGASVYPGRQKEIGWFDIMKTDSVAAEPLLHDFESTFPVFHWHGDTFDLPAQCSRLFSSAITPNQAFLYKEKVLGLQFHFEVTADSMREMLTHGAGELIESDTIQSAEKILSHTALIEANNQKMFSILNYFEQKNL